MANLSLRASFKRKDGGGGTKVELSLLSFMEEDLHVVYSPSLDMFGYGESEAEAKASFNCALEEFLRYTENKKTLENELKRLGWNVGKPKAKKRKLEAPNWDELLRDNEYLTEVVRTKPHHQINQSIQIPDFA